MCDAAYLTHGTRTRTTRLQSGCQKWNGAGVPIVQSDIPARLDRLPWGRFHSQIAVGLGQPESSTDLMAVHSAERLKKAAVVQFDR